MKNFNPIVIIVISFFLTAFTVHRIYFPAEKVLVVDTRPAIEVMMPKIEAPKIEINLRDHSSFLNKIGHYESGNRYEKVNRWGYMGRYQFGQETLQALDIKVSKKKFLSSPILQEEAMSRLLEANKHTLRRYIRKYDSKVVNGIYVTESGILAAAHLGGAGSVIDWFKNGTDFKDANGTPITRYMKLFSGYELDLE